MRWYYKLLIGLGFATVGYIIGNIIPLEFLRPIVVSSEIKSADYYQIIIGTISAFVTFIAVIIKYSPSLDNFTSKIS
jgi:predicted PurR-regulated permease PerM